MCDGVGRSGLPIPKSIMSSPRARAAIFKSLTILKTYGGKRSIRGKFGFTTWPIAMPHDARAQQQGGEMDGGTLRYKRKKALKPIEDSDLGQRAPFTLRALPPVYGW
ncbi:MAG: hypothetical protein ACI8PT_003893 [Gammaproteobacteria bacterium]|jgi:hypothetical protein